MHATKHVIMKLKELNAKERPRERLLSNGAGALSNAELLAILLRTGSEQKNVLEIAQELLASAGNLTGLSAMSTERMTTINGIGFDKAVTIAAAFELGKRFAVEKSIPERISITSPSQIYALMQPMLKGLDHEECWIIFLNRSNFIISKEKLTTGGLTSTVIDSNMIIRKALEKKADGLVIVHNHPSGNPYPGSADLKQTATLKKAVDVFGISLIDHVIIADTCFYSFADENVTYQNEVITEKLAPV